MKGQQITKRLALIFYLVKRGGYPSLADIKEYLREKDFDQSERNLKRDLATIRDQLGIVIKYDHFHRGYYVDRNETISKNSFESMIELSNINDLIIENMKGFGMQPDYLEIESRIDLAGMENFKPLMKAIRERKVVTFDYFKYTTGESGHYKMSPYFIKEYERRWYVIGVKEGAKGRRIFGMDRITNLKISHETFTRDERVLNTRFGQIMGVNFMREETEKVLLEFSVKRGRYVKSLPWHSSQRVIEESEDKILIELTVYPSWELFNKIMQFGHEVRVVEPDWLAVKIREEYEMGLSLYKE